MLYIARRDSHHGKSTAEKHDEKDGKLMAVISQNELNPSQLEAVRHGSGPLLVIAGAGSGKTRVIECRARHLVGAGEPASSILLLTFTRRAAAEMIRRSAQGDERCRSIEGGTFHSFANKILRRYAPSLGLPREFTILDKGDAAQAVERCARQLGFRERKERIPGKETLLAIISGAINRRQPVRDVIEKNYFHFLDQADDIATLAERYQEFKLEIGACDYDDLLVYLCILLREDGMRRRINGKYRYLMVDEFQDTNALQGEITKLLGEHQNVMVVGDDAQSIYRFRGANRENIMEFPTAFPGCRTVTLDTNYRSRQSILDLANALLGGMKHFFPKCMKAASSTTGAKPELHVFNDSHDEAEWMAGKIKELRDEGVALSTQAVLYRSTYLSIPVQMALKSRNIPFVVYGGLRFSEAAHVKDLMAHLRVLSNPKDGLAWDRIFQLVEGIGPKKTERLFEEVAKTEILEGACAALEAVSGNYGDSCHGIRSLAVALQGAAGLQTPIEQYEALLGYYRPLMERYYDDWHERLGDLEAIQEVVTKYRRLDELLADFALEPTKDRVQAVEERDDEDEKPLVLSTIHSAKGLEWRQVFLLGVADGMLPNSRSVDDEEDLEEERRLLYVAITRAREGLHLSMHNLNRHGNCTLNRLSRFLEAEETKQCLRQAVAAHGLWRPDGGEAETEPSMSRKELLQRAQQLRGG